MINYFITSFLLSAMVGIIYLLILKQRTPALHRKLFIYLVIISSLLLPAFTDYAEDDLSESSLRSEHVAMPFGSQIDLHEIQLKHYCQCENPNFAHHVSYRSNNLYNFFVEHKRSFSLILLIAMGLVLLRIMLQYLYLFRILGQSDKEERIFEGKKYTILHTHKPHSIGAFQLGKAYIIWQEEMGQLSEQEIHAILQHELSHLRQYNTIEKAALSLIQCWWLLNPFFYFFRKELDLISELIADQRGALALGSRKQYAALLLKLTEIQTLAPVSHFLGANDLKSRIQHILKSPPQMTFRPFMAVMLLLGLQFALVNTLSAQVDDTLKQFETYEEIYLNHPEEDSCYYCTDCHTVCFPGDE